MGKPGFNKHTVSVIVDHLADYSRIPYLKERRRTRGCPDAVFIWIPKTAGTSLITALAPLNASMLPKPRYARYRFAGRGVVTFGHTDYSQLLEKGYVSTSFDESAFKFAFVRDPYSRAVSLFRYLERRRKLGPGATFLSFCRMLRDEGCPPIGLYNTHGLNQCNPQVRWLDTTDVDFVGRFESLEDDAAVIFERLGLPDATIPRLNTTRRSARYKEHFCEESKQIVEDFYREDFERLGYEVEDFPVVSQAAVEDD